MRYCKKCLNPSTRPNIVFDGQGVCPVCRHHEDRKLGKIDWTARRRELLEIAEWGRDNSKASYDCIVGVSGGKDSTRQACIVRDELGLNPLLVSCVYPPEQLVERGARNMGNMVSLGFDHLSFSLKPQVWKDMMRKAFFEYGNWCKSTELALYAIPVHVAIAHKIPLIFLGENPVFSIGEMHGSATGEATRMKYSNTLSGGRPEQVMPDHIGLKDVHFYTYPSDEDMDHAGVRIVYLGYYIEDFNSFENMRFSVERGLSLRQEPIEEVGDITRAQSLDEDFYMMNQMLKYLKFGFGQVTDKVCEAINLGLMTREEGVELVKKYDGKCHSRYVERFCSYLEISIDQFWSVAESYRDHNIWKKDSNGEWVLRVAIGTEVEG